MKLQIGYLMLVFLFGSVMEGFTQNTNSSPYNVGFNYFKLQDTTRKYIIDNDTVSRPLLMHFWYPSHENNIDSSLNFKNYIDLISKREKFNIPSSEVDGYTYNFIDAYAGFAKQHLGIDTNLTTQQILDYSVNAHHGIKMVKKRKKFPLIIYAPSNSKSAVQNHIICEDLASHGFMVISVGSAGNESLSRKNDQISIMAQVFDMEYILKYFEDSLKLKHHGLGLFGFSTGGLATTIFQMRNEDVGAVFSMDGSQEYGHYITLSKVDDFNLNKMKVPYCILTNNYENFSIYPFYNSIVSNDKYMFRMPYLDHNGFVSYWKFFDLCSSKHSLNRFCTSYDYISSAAVVFFNTFLKPLTAVNPNLTLDIKTNEYLEFVIDDNSDVAQLANLILTYNIDSAIIYLEKNMEVFRSKENEINTLSRLFKDPNTDASIQLLLINEKMHPNSWQILLELGSTYKMNGDLSLAKETVLKAQQLNPENSEIISLLKEINEVGK